MGIISHSNNGFDLQTIGLKSHNHQDRRILVPNARKLVYRANMLPGYDRLFNIAIEQLNSINSDRFLDVKQSKNIATLGLGRNAKSELLRSRNGLWRELTPPLNFEIPEIEFSDEHRELLIQLNECDFLVFETFTEGRLRSRLHATIEHVLGRDVELLSDEAIAKAALFAAERYAKDIPIYFDYLPQISTIVQTGLEPTNFDLIDQSETLRAGTVYRSKKPAILGTQAGQQEIEIYLKKEGDLQPRQARVQLPVAATSTHSVSVYVEQTPAQGRAAIQIYAVDLGLSQTIDFQAAEVLDETWEEILEKIQIGAVPIPERIVIAADIEKWLDGDDGEGLISLINREVDKEYPNWELLSNGMDFYAISSDGDLPKDIDLRTKENLNKLSHRAVEQFKLRLNGDTQGDNLPLRFLTWQFKRCPQEVCASLINFWQHHGESNFIHPITRHDRSWVLVFQGVGRAVFDEKLELSALSKLLSIPVKDWAWERHTACASLLVSRSKTAHKHLNAEMVQDLLERVKIEFSNNFEDKLSRIPICTISSCWIT